MEINIVDLVILLLLAVILIAAAVTDIRSLYVPDIIPLCIAGLAVVTLVAGQEHGPALTSRICGSLVIGGAMLGVSLLTKGGIGGGDIKLMAASGLLLGFPRNLLAFILAYLAAGLLYTLPLLTGKIDRNRPIPMIPYFAVSILFSCLFGDRLIGWYLQFFY